MPSHTGRTDIPPRIDLGKSKYGGPFTTEQVEDVKTVLRLLAITLPFSVLALSFTFFANTWTTYRLIRFKRVAHIISVDSLLLFSPYAYGIVGVIAHEFIIYPLIRNRLPSILKRIGAASLLVTLISFISIHSQVSPILILFQ